MSDFTHAQSFELGTASGWGEDFIQRLLIEQPALLGLGELESRGREVRQRRAGRLDVLLVDSEDEYFYEVEVQLGKTDPSHIIRTIEYWDLARRRYPEYKHIAVIVAEEITSRFFNVISLFNQHIPIIAIKMTALQIGEHKTVTFTKILDHVEKSLVPEEELSATETTRGEWEKRTSQEVMILVDRIASLARQIDPSIVVKYNRGSVVLKRGNAFWRFLTLKPKKKFLRLLLPLQQSDALEAELSGSGISFGSYDTLRRRYSLHLLPDSLPKNETLLSKLIRSAAQQEQQEVFEED